jgi:hypothetical protein
MVYIKLKNKNKKSNDISPHKLLDKTKNNSELQNIG